MIASEPSTRKVTASAPKRTMSDHASVADIPRTPRARASANPGASTTAVAPSSRR